MSPVSQALLFGGDGATQLSNGPVLYIRCAYRWTRDSLLNFRLKISLAQLTD